MMNISSPPLRKAVFPVAGLGTRFLPATKASPKEMLTIVDKPLIQYAVEEAYAAGIRQMIFVTGYNKRAIEDHFDTAYQLESELYNHKKYELLSVVQSIKPEDMDCFFIRQPKALGLGHAILCVENLIGNEAFAILLADDLIISSKPIMKQMAEVYAEHGCSILAVQDVSWELTQNYGIVQGLAHNDFLLRINDLVEKPKVAASNTAVVGRYILTSTIFDKIRTLPTHNNSGEIQLTDAINLLLKEEQVLGYRYEGVRYDCGSKLGFLKANVALGKMHPVEGNEFSEWLLDSLTPSQSIGD